MRSDGGPAFPQPDVKHAVDRVRGGQVVSFMAGMTMRQYYKGQAIVGMLSSNPRVDQSDRRRGEVLLTESASVLADAMIAEDEEFAKKEQRK